MSFISPRILFLIRNRQIQGVLLVVFSAAAFGSMAVLARIAYSDGASPTTLLFLRYSIAAVVLAGIVYFRGSTYPRGAILCWLFILGGIIYTGVGLSYFTAVVYASAGLVSLLMSLYPVFVTLLSSLFLKERMTRAKLLAMGLALGGAILTIGPVGAGRPAGVALALFAAIIYAVYIVAGSVITEEAPAIVATTVIMISAGLVFAAVAIFQGFHFPATSAGWLAIIAIALVSTVMAMAAFLEGIDRVGPTNAAMLSMVEPATGVALAAVVLGEQLQPMRILGGMLIIVSVLIISKYAVMDHNA
jgi:drug/metabolite transporter (DMT)-like permease